MGVGPTNTPNVDSYEELDANDVQIVPFEASYPLHDEKTSRLCTNTSSPFCNSQEVTVKQRVATIGYWRCKCEEGSSKNHQPKENSPTDKTGCQNHVVTTTMVENIDDCLIVPKHFQNPGDRALLSAQSLLEPNAPGCVSWAQVLPWNYSIARSQPNWQALVKPFIDALPKTATWHTFSLQGLISLHILSETFTPPYGSVSFMTLQRTCILGRQLLTFEPMANCRTSGK